MEQSEFGIDASKITCFEVRQPLDLRGISRSLFRLSFKTFREGLLYWPGRSPFPSPSPIQERNHHQCRNRDRGNTKPVLNKTDLEFPPSVFQEIPQTQVNRTPDQNSRPYENHKNGKPYFRGSRDQGHEMANHWHKEPEQQPPLACAMKPLRRSLEPLRSNAEIMTKPLYEDKPGGASETIASGDPCHTPRNRCQ